MRALSPHIGARAELDGNTHSPIYQAVGSPLRNPLGVPERLFMRLGWSKPAEKVGKKLSRLTGVKSPDITWRLLHDDPWFDNHISTLKLRGREASLQVEKTTPEDNGEPRLEKILEHKLA